MKWKLLKKDRHVVKDISARRYKTQVYFHLGIPVRMEWGERAGGKVNYFKLLINESRIMMQRAKEQDEDTRSIRTGTFSMPWKLIKKYIPEDSGMGDIVCRFDNGNPTFDLSEIRFREED